MFFKKKSYEDEDELKSPRLKVWHKVAIGVFALCFVFLFIPQSAIENLVKKANEPEDTIPEEQQVLEVVEEDSEGNFKFDTVFGGTDYKAEYDAFWSENTLEGHELLEEHLSTTDLAAIFDSLAYTGEYINENDMSFYSGSGDLVEFAKTCKVVMLTNDIVNIGVFQNYYGLYWMRGTNMLFVKDNRDSVYDSYYFTRQLEHFGKTTEISMNTAHYLLEEFSSFQIFYLGKEN